MNVLYIKVKEESKFHKAINKFREVFKRIFCIVDLEEIFNGYIASVPINIKEEEHKQKVEKINKNTTVFEDVVSNRGNIAIKNLVSNKETVTFKDFILNRIMQIKNCIIARKIRRIVNEKNIDGIVLSDDIKRNTDFLDKLIIRKKHKTVKSSEKNFKKTGVIENLNYATNNIIKTKSFIKERKIFFFDGNGLFEYIIYEILMYIINIQNRKPELEDIYIIANNIDEVMLGNIIFLSTKFKNVNIVSKNIGKYDYIETLVYNNTGNSVLLLNNKRKSLRRAKYIINVDNSIKELNEYLIYRKAIIINMQLGTEKQEKMILTGFEGIFVNSFEIDLNDKTKQFFKEYGLINITSMSILYESFLNKKENFENIREKIEDAGLVVKKLYGNNGIIDENEYKRVNLTDNEAKKYY